ncbi:MAG: glutaredoxin [Candidatus Eremiobacteraeota bacterium]|nr:glutaredoxin [Candidatus Eremiobacteraeota bacterium]
MLELFGAGSCPYTKELREQLLFEGEEFVEYDVEANSEALARMLSLTGGNNMVPVLVHDAQIKEVGWNGSGCYVTEEPAARTAHGD